MRYRQPHTSATLLSLHVLPRRFRAHTHSVELANYWVLYTLRTRTIVCKSIFCSWKVAPSTRYPMKSLMFACVCFSNCASWLRPPSAMEDALAVEETAAGALPLVDVPMLPAVLAGGVTLEHDMARRVFSPTAPYPVVAAEPADTIPCADCHALTACSVFFPRRPMADPAGNRF